jgi:glutamine synthetase
MDGAAVTGALIEGWSGQVNSVDLASVIENSQIDQVEVAWPDQTGHVLGKRIPATRFLSKARGDGFTFCDAAFAWNTCGEVVDDISLSNVSTGFPDVFAVPDFATARLLPWRPGTVQVIADIVDHHRHPVRTSPRAVLRRVIGKLAELGYSAQVGVELEFYLLNADGTLPHDGYQCYSLEKANQLDPGFQQIIDTVTGFIPLEAAHVEYAPAQVELNLHYADALTAADDGFRLRYAVKEAARRAGLLATFMAKPFTEFSGCSGHLHISLWRDDEPAFAPVNGAESPLALNAVGGLLKHLPGITIYGSPTVNSYKRFTTGAFAPTTATWSGDNRTGAVRSLLETPEATRIELRTPSSDANPYYSIAAALAAIIDGIQTGALPPGKGTGDLDSAKERMPANLGEALDMAEADTTINEILGTDAAHDFASLARSEWVLYNQEVTQWEVQRYLFRT